MTAAAPCLVVGASLAGATAALTLRELGFGGDLVLVGDEPELPYERPALSKEYLVGTMSAEQLQVRPRETYDDMGIELRLGTAVTALLPTEREVVLDSGERLPYSTVVIATGASNIRPPIPGAARAGVHQLRTLSDAAAIRAAAAQAQRAVVVGMGFIGCEIAASLRQLEVEVTAVDELAGPLLAQLGPQLSRWVRSWHEEHGVNLLFERSVSEIGVDMSRLSVRTTAGDSLPADLVVVGVGVRPNVEWLVGTPLHAPSGIEVDADCRTRLPDVYAIGDVAAVNDDRVRVHRRFEHWNNAIEQGRRVAHTILGLEPPPLPVPYFWSAQYGHYLQYVGEHSAGAHIVAREVDARYTAFYLEAGIVRAAGTIDNGKDLRRARALLGHSLEPRDLANPDIDLRELAARLPP